LTSVRFAPVCWFRAVDPAAKPFFLQDEGGDRPHRIVGERAGTGGGHVRVLETEKVPQRFVAPLPEERIAGQSRSLSTRQIGPVAFCAVVVEILLATLRLLLRVPAVGAGSMCAAGRNDRRAAKHGKRDAKMHRQISRSGFAAHVRLHVVGQVRN